MRSQRAARVVHGRPRHWVTRRHHHNRHQTRSPAGHFVRLNPAKINLCPLGCVGALARARAQPRDARPLILAARRESCQFWPADRNCENYHYYHCYRLGLAACPPGAAAIGPGTGGALIWRQARWRAALAARRLAGSLTSLGPGGRPWKGLRRPRSPAGALAPGVAPPSLAIVLL